MKAKLLIHDNTIVLLKRNGEILHLSASAARSFLLTFQNENHYSGEGTWNYEGLSMETYPGVPVAHVADEGHLVVTNADLFCGIIVNGEMDFLSVTEYANLHGKSTTMVRRLCQQGKMPGAILKKNGYFIPSNTPYPKG